MTAIRRQGAIFCAAALLTAALSPLLAQADPAAALAVLAALILLLGVPHGALDPVFARNVPGMQRGVQGMVRWAGFWLGYLVLAAGMVLLWRLAPAVFLLGFLAISAAHFSGDPAAGAPPLARMLHGGAPIVLPTLLHAGEVGRLFTLLAGADAAALVLPALHALAWPWLLGLALMAAWRARTDGLAGLELASVGMLASVAPPLPAFTVFFCGMHSPRHILRTAVYAGSSLRAVLLGCAGPMLLTALGAMAAWWWLDGVAVEARVIQLVFVGLAALTVPHMALVERVRLRGWAGG